MKETEISLEKMFSRLVIIFGFLIIILTPPMTVADENAHFINSYKLSVGNIFPDMKDDKIGTYIPANVAEFVNNNNQKYSGHLEVKNTFQSFYFDSWLPNSNDSIIFYESSLTTINPIGYIFSATGMLFGRIISSLISAEANLPFNSLLFGRIGNLIAFAFISYTAIKNTGYYKRTMFILCLMPMTLFLGSSISYDAILIPTAFLMFSLFTRLMKSSDDYKVNFNDILQVCFIAFIFGGVKQMGLPLLMLFLFLPREKYGCNKKFYQLIFLVGTISICSFLIPSIVSSFITKDATNINLYSAIQQSYLLENLHIIPNLIFNTFTKFSEFYITGFFGILGQLDTNFPLPILTVFYLVLLYIVIIDSSNITKISFKTKLVSLSSVLVSLGGILCYIYIDWTARPEVVGVGAKYISGLQGRYYIPLFLFLAIVFANKYKIKDKYIRFGNILTIDCGIVCASITVLILLLRYW